MSEETFQEPVLPLPSVITSFREDLVEPINWDIVPSAGEFGAKVDFVSGVMAIPLAGDAHSQRQQLKQLIQARVTPLDDSIYDELAKRYKIQGMTTGILRAAESARISAITELFAEVKGLKLEPDGSEKITGKRLATANTAESWDRSVEFTLRNHGTKAFDSFASGVRSVNPEWSTALRKLNKRLIGTFNGSAADLGDTSPCSYGDDLKGPVGFQNTLYAANAVRDYLSDGYQAPQEMREMTKKSEDERAAKYGKTDKVDYEKNTLGDEQIDLDDSDIPDDFEFSHDDGGFAELIIDDTMPLTVEVNGYMRRKRRGMTSGRRVTYPSRMLTDPNRRVFGTKVKVKGGIVVVDISGSMSLSQEDIEAIVEAAPAAVIIAYSYCGSGVPNAWILANRGWRVRDVGSIGGRGNGVDGPALTWAIRHKKHNEDIVWVSDGQVTTERDGQNDEIVTQCAKLIKKHRIIMIPSVREAVAMFKNGKLVNKPAGPIRDALLGKPW